MTGDYIQSQNMRAGLRKACVTFCSELLNFYDTKIEKDLPPPEHYTSGWKRGSFSFHYVRAVEHWTQYFFMDMETIAMARNSKGKSNGKSLESYSFVRCELTSEDKKAAKIWIDENMGDMAAIVHDTVASDYKMSISFSSEHDTFTASLTGKEGAVNEYKTLTARHKDWHVAVMTVLYKHGVMFKSRVWESEDTADDGWS